MRQRRVIAQLAVLVARNVVDLADGGEHFRLLDGVHAEVGFQIKIDIQHVFGIAGLLHHQVEDAFLHRIASAVVAGVTTGDEESVGSRRESVRLQAVSAVFGAGVVPARSGRFSYTNRITCASVG